MPLLKSNDFWKPNTYYYATERYKSLIEKDNTLYICKESHFSQDEFDATKLGNKLKHEKEIALVYL